MQSQSVEEGRQAFHKNQDGDSQGSPYRECDPESNSSNPAFKHQPITEHHVPQYLRQLCNIKHITAHLTKTKYCKYDYRISNKREMIQKCHSYDFLQKYVKVISYSRRQGFGDSVMVV
jgi:hypothetical protein